MRKKNESTEPFDYAQTYQQLAAQIHEIHFMRTDEMPRIDLYLDQLISLVTTELSPLYEPKDKIVTGAIVNNYVKQKVIAAPTRKRYNRHHLTTLMLVCCLKRVLTLSQISALLMMCDFAGVDVEDAYDELVSALERALAARFPDDLSQVAELEPESFHVSLFDREGRPVTGELPAIVESVIGLVVNRAFVEKLLALEERRAQAAAAQE